jgi:hypothetical protein
MADSLRIEEHKRERKRRKAVMKEVRIRAKRKGDKLMAVVSQRENVKSYN